MFISVYSAVSLTLVREWCYIIKNDLLLLSLMCFCAGVEDGQTVRMPVGSQEVFITFKVNMLILECQGV